MVVNLRVLYFEKDKEPFVPVDRVNELFDIEFEENEFPEQGIPVRDIFQILEQCGWKINAKRNETSIKVILTQEELCGEN